MCERPKAAITVLLDDLRAAEGRDSEDLFEGGCRGCEAPAPSAFKKSESRPAGLKRRRQRKRSRIKVRLG